MKVNRRTALRAGLGTAAIALTHHTASSAVAGTSHGRVNPRTRGEDGAVRKLRRELDRAADGGSSSQLDDSGRRIVEADPITYVLKRPLIIGPDTTLRATGATFVSDYPLVNKEYTTDRSNWHSPTPTYPDTFTSRAVSAEIEPTLLLNHVPDSNTNLYRAPGNIRIEGGVWDPSAHYLHDAVGQDFERGTDAPPMNAITFQHTRDVEVVGVTVRNVKWWHAVEFNAVRNATLIDSVLEGWIENPTTGLWNCDAVQIDIPQEHTKWAGAADLTPARDIRLLDNYCGPSDTRPAWAKLGCSHSWADDVYSDIWIEGNTIEDSLWDAILPMNTSRITIRENKIVNCRGGIYVKTAGENPLSRVDIVGNSITLVEDTDRPTIGVVGSSANVNINDVAVYGNEGVTGGSFWYKWANFRREPQD